MNPSRRRICPYCHQWFLPDLRCSDRQRACSTPDCQKARKADAQQRWLKKPENRDFWRGSANTQRVREWRLKHPGYWKRNSDRTTTALQDECPSQTPTSEDGREDHETLLQDDFLPEDPLLVGIIATVAKTALQVDIVTACRQLVQIGGECLRTRKGQKGQIKVCAQDFGWSGAAISDSP